MMKFKERGHHRAERLDLKKPHIMYCKFLQMWLLAAYSWKVGIDEEQTEKAWEFCIYLNGVDS